MKTLKFRAYDTITEYMFVQGTPGLETIQSFFFHIPKNAHLMQSTGLLDKNGEEIYEGDVCHFLRRDSNVFDGDQKRTFSVGWSSSQGRWGISDSNIPLAHFESENLEVIGNIYENSELLD